MRAALIITATYQGNSQFPPLLSAGVGAEIVEQYCTLPRLGFEATTLPLTRQLPFTLGEQLLRLEGAETLLVYVNGYIAMSQERGAALLLDGPRLKALPWAKIHGMLAPLSAQKLVIVDATAIPGTSSAPSEIIQSIGTALTLEDPSISALVSVHSTTRDVLGAPRFTDLFVAASEYLAATENSLDMISVRRVFDQMRQERASFARVAHATHFHGSSEFPLLNTPQTGAAPLCVLDLRGTASPISEPHSPADALPSFQLETDRGDSSSPQFDEQRTFGHADLFTAAHSAPDETRFVPEVTVTLERGEPSTLQSGNHPSNHQHHPSCPSPDSESDEDEQTPAGQPAAATIATETSSISHIDELLGDAPASAPLSGSYEAPAESESSPWSSELASAVVKHRARFDTPRPSVEADEEQSATTRTSSPDLEREQSGLQESDPFAILHDSRPPESGRLEESSESPATPSAPFAAFAEGNETSSSPERSEGGTNPDTSDAERHQGDPALDSSDAELRQSDPALDSSDAELRQSDPALDSSDEELRQRDPALDSSDAELRQSDSALESSDEELRRTDRALDSGDAELRQSDPALESSDEELRRTDRALDSSPPSIPSAAWSRLHHGFVDDDSHHAEDYGDNRDDYDDDGDLDADSLLRAAAAQPLDGSDRLSPPIETELHTNGTVEDSGGRLPTLPPAPRTLSSPPPPPGILRRTLAPPPSRIRPPSRPPTTATAVIEGFAPTSSREVRAAVHAHLDSGERRARGGDPQSAVEHYRRALNLGIPEPAEEADVRCRLATLLIAQGSRKVAVVELERAMELDPEHPTARITLIDQLRELGASTRLRELCEQRLSATTDQAEQIALLDVLADEALDSGENELAILWLQRRVSLDAAVRPLEQLSEGYRRTEDWPALIATQKRLADYVAELPERRALALEVAARAAALHLEDREQSLSLIRLAWEATPYSLDRVLRAEALFESASDVVQLVAFYESILRELVDEDQLTSLAIATSHVCQAKLFDHTRAAHVVSAAIHRAPNSARLRLELSRLYLAHDETELAKQQALAALLLDPLLADAFGLLSEAFAAQGLHDDAWRSASVAVGLGSSMPTTAELAGRFCPESLAIPNRSLSPDDWRLLDSASAPELLETALQKAEPALTAAYIKFQGKKPDWLNSATELDVTASTATLARSVLWASRFVGLDAPRLWVADDSAAVFRVGAVPDTALVVSRELTSGLDLVQLAFLCARKLAFAHPESFLLSLLGSPEEALAWLRLCFTVIADQPLAEGAAGNRKTATELKKRLSEEAQESLRALRQSCDDNALLEMLNSLYCQAARVATKVGLLACGDPARAVRLVREMALPHLPVGEQLRELTQFAISPTLAGLRQELGLSIPADGDASV